MLKLSQSRYFFNFLKAISDDAMTTTPMAATNMRIEVDEEPTCAVLFCENFIAASFTVADIVDDGKEYC